jgi:hypothetical protein
VQDNKVVIRYLNGSSLKGTTRDFSPDKTSFHLEQINGETVEIEIEGLKAIFFVKDLEGDKRHANTYQDLISGAGRLIRVIFIDGERITGFTQGYSPDRQGFFMIPAELNGNNERIYVIRDSTARVELCADKSCVQKRGRQ